MVLSRQLTLSPHRVRFLCKDTISLALAREKRADLPHPFRMNRTAIGRRRPLSQSCPADDLDALCGLTCAYPQRLDTNAPIRDTLNLVDLDDRALWSRSPNVNERDGHRNGL